ncbi:PIN domain-containing protein [Geomonas oryzisoli]|uniref:PIN domain-containing protein n=1 Tax=Geomonas oryzisoli TaxID=2847992 RepID=A0ABX8JBF4_9BACT|nr:PIN domain-containing protein [Geomonas oryzisoli]QWV94481.1 PIN domain-containing protein [Geomonas oryzisoli]
MKKYVIDTNAIISFVTDRNPAQQEAVIPLFTAASRLKCTLVCHQFVLTEFIFVMDTVYGIPKKTINAMVLDLIAMPGVEVRHEIDFNKVLSLWPDQVGDFGDAIVASVGVAVKGAIVVTFDGKFKSALKRQGVDVYQA